MVQCRALRDGLIGQTQYVRAGETFLAGKCPSWAEPVKAKQPKEADKQEPQEGK
jgi:hypothetical protein